MVKKKFINERIQFIRDKLCTETEYNTSVYGEKLINSHGMHFRTWDPKRSKLSASIINGMKDVPILEDSTVLYLGASFGTTVSHISDIIPFGTVFAVEFSPEPFAKLLKISENRKNIYPLLENARMPETYGFFLEKDPDVIYQDISQRDQINILSVNLSYYHKWQYAILALKTTSIDSSKKPKDILEESVKKMKLIKNIYITEVIDISNYHKGHFLIVMRNIGLS